MSAFIDVPAPDFESSVTFWVSATGWAPSVRRGGNGEFLSLVPPDADDHLRMQRVDDRPPRVHLDLHVADPRVAADRAVTLGAVEVSDHGYVVMRSPGGLSFCLVTHPASQVAAAATWPGGSRSRIDQVCLDIPRATFDREAGFWRSMLGWSLVGSARPEFERLGRPDGQPLHVLLQRVGSDVPVRAHLDIACSSRERELLRHVGLGARVVAERDAWTVMTDPAGMTYCLTDRLPD